MNRGEAALRLFRKRLQHVYQGLAKGFGLLDKRARILFEPTDSLLILPLVFKLPDAQPDGLFCIIQWCCHRQIHGANLPLQVRNPAWRLGFSQGE